ncbi:hypothetical protein HanPI659440_Chr13g0499711 [Helianthus annuus]|nr:hypothetical protein HanPI659440_Chr13g0499711 [Helianthus annuus]
MDHPCTFEKLGNKSKILVNHMDHLCTLNFIINKLWLFVFVHLTNRTKFLVHVRSLTKQTTVNELPAERFTNCSLNVRFIYSPNNKNTSMTIII